jgi:hypothetical protein
MAEFLIKKPNTIAPTIGKNHTTASMTMTIPVPMAAPAASASELTSVPDAAPTADMPITTMKIVQVRAKFLSTFQPNPPSRTWFAFSGRLARYMGTTITPSRKYLPPKAQFSPHRVYAGLHRKLPIRKKPKNHHVPHICLPSNEAPLQTLTFIFGLALTSSSKLISQLFRPLPFAPPRELVLPFFTQP